jgi:nucleotide-binding universal stress UspA family protein
MTLIGCAPALRRILVALDDSEASDPVLAQALEIATSEASVEVHLLHVIVPPAAPYLVMGSRSIAAGRAAFVRRADEALAAVLARHPERKAPKGLLCHVLVDEPAHAIAQAATDLDADLVLVGSHGRHAAARLFLGSVAEAVVRLAPCPVLVVRPKAGGSAPKSSLTA